MSDVRRVRHPWHYYRTECGTRDYRSPGFAKTDEVVDDPSGTHALLPWTEWERQQAEIERLRDGHCLDCCCARAWEALCVTEYTGRSIPEEIERLQNLAGQRYRAWESALDSTLTASRERTRADRAEARLRAVVEASLNLDQSDMLKIVEAAEYERCYHCEGGWYKDINCETGATEATRCDVPDCIHGWRPRGEDDE